MRLLSPKAMTSWTEGYNDGFWGREAASRSPFYLQGYEEGKRTATVEAK